MKTFTYLLSGFMILCLGGCASIGSQVIVRDRLDYSVAIAESWKSQMLLNVVKMRYGDTPVFMDVTSVINLVGVQNTVNMAAGWSFPPSANSQAIGGSTTWGEKPTITYAPLSGEKFTKSLLTPISPPSLLYLLQAGWPVRLLFSLCVKSINDMDNQTSAPGFAQTQDPEFQQLLGLLEKIQKSGAVGIRIDKKDRQEATAVIAFRGKASKETALEISESRRLLGLKPGTTEFRVLYGTAPMQDGEIAMLTRSIMDIIIELSAQIEVPAEQIAEGRTYATSPAIGEGKNQVAPLVRIQSGKEKPSDSFVTMNYRDHWFWIDDRDRKSKAIFSFLMILFSLVETGAPPQAPTITVPIG
jgi:hypothetical protein